MSKTENKAARPPLYAFECPVVLDPNPSAREVRGQQSDVLVWARNYARLDPDEPATWPDAITVIVAARGPRELRMADLAGVCAAVEELVGEGKSITWAKRWVEAPKSGVTVEVHGG